MSEQLDNTLVNENNGASVRPQFLKVISILSYISCGFWILLFALGTLCFGIKEETVTQIWDKVLETSPQLNKDIDPMAFFHSVGMLCLYNLLLNVFSLLGVLMMWRLNKMGFYIYVAAELVINFTGYLTELGQMGETSIGQMAFNIVLDAVFIGLFAANLKAMKNPSEQVV